jgi:NADH dehydrogenase
MPRPRVIIIGGGFGGLQCARSLAESPVDVLLLDRNNYHLFTPLLYQVASSLLNPSDIAYPIRAALQHAPNVRFLMAEAASVDLAVKVVRTADGAELPYDYIVVAAGSETNFFGLESVGRAACGLKDLPEALALRNHVLRCFEAASREASAAVRSKWLTFIVVGGGPTGVEYAGALSELVRLALRHDYPEIPSGEIRILLVEALKELFPTFLPRFGRDARERLQRLGVDVRLDTRVQGVSGDQVALSTGAVEAKTLVWAAGVKPARLAAGFASARSRTGRLEVDEYLRLRGQEKAYAIGDIASFLQDGREIPMIATPAMQQARCAAANILLDVAGRPLTPFRYRDPGMMATIGRNAGVAQVDGLSLRGFPGWIAWLFVHLYFLIGFRNRLAVLMGWAWNYLRYDRPIRIIARAGDRNQS